MSKQGFTFLAYAKHRKDMGLSGTSCEAVSKAVKAGRISVNEFNRIPDLDMADKEWEENTSHGHRRAAAAKGENEKNSHSVEITGDSVEKKGGSSENNSETASSSSDVEPEKMKPAANSLADAKTKEAYWSAQLKELDYKKKAGQLVDAKAIEREAFNMARQVRDQILQLPQKHCHELVAIKNSDEMEIRLTEILNKALQDLTSNEPSSGEEGVG